MRDTDLSVALSVYERLRRQIADQAFSDSKGTIELEITCSIGVTVSREQEDAATLLKR